MTDNTEIFYVVRVSCKDPLCAEVYLVGSDEGEPATLAAVIDKFKEDKSLDSVELSTQILITTPDVDEADYFFDRLADEVMKMAQKR